LKELCELLMVKHEKTAKQRFYDIVNGQAAAYGVAADIEWIEGPDVVDNDLKLTKWVVDETAKHLNSRET
jgi:amidohydrolase